MQLLSCAKKTCGGYNTTVVNYRTAAMRGKASGGCNTSAGNYATAAMRGKTSGGCNTGAGIYAMELLPCAEKPVAVAI